VTSELRAEPGETWARDEGQAGHPGRHRRAPEARSSYREVFAIGEFRALWSAQVLSFAGDQFVQVAIAILVYGRTHFPFLTAPAYALTYLPPIAGGPLLTLLLFGWLAGFYVVPGGLAAPYARSLHGNAVTVGLLMAAVPLGMVIGAFVISRIAAPSARMRMMGWLAVLSCATAAAFVQALHPDTRARAFGVAQSGPYAVQGLGILAGGAVAQLIGAPLAVGLVGLTAATMLAMSWTHLRGRLIQALPNGPESPGRGG
jgi:hypothetical protein